MKCRHCGHDIEASSRFCLYCGAQVQEEKTRRVSGGKIALIIILVCSIVLVTSALVYAFASGLVTGNLNTPGEQSGNRTAEDSGSNTTKSVNKKVRLAQEWYDRVSSGTEDISLLAASDTSEGDLTGLEAIRAGAFTLDRESFIFLKSENGYYVFEVVKIFNDTAENIIITFRERNGKFVYDLNREVFEHLFCPACGGSGFHTEGGVICAICGGAGVQYIPNQWFDGTMWHGNYVGCSGCGGSGYAVMPSTVPCSTCGGSGINLR